MLQTGLMLSGLDASMAAAVRDYLVPWVAYRGLSAYIPTTGGYRDWTEQDRLYRLGRSAYQISARVKLRGTQGSVTDAPAGYSAHNWGLAIDVEGPDQAAVVALAAQLGFGTVDWDPAHIEWPNWSRYVQLPP